MAIAYQPPRLCVPSQSQARFTYANNLKLPAMAQHATEADLQFPLHHPRARSAIHASFDVPALISGLGGLDLAAFDVASRVRDRKDYRRCTDCGRTLDPDSVQLLASRAGGTCQPAIDV